MLVAMTRMSRSSMSMMTAVCGVGATDADVVHAAGCGGVRRLRFCRCGHVGSGGECRVRCLRGRPWGAGCRRRRVSAVERSVWSSVVVFVDERVELVLEFGDGVGLRVWAPKPFLEGLVEPFDLPAGGGVVGSGVLLFDLEAGEAGLEAVAAALRPPANRVVKTMTVVGEDRGGKPLVSAGRDERVDDDVAVDSAGGR